MPNFELKAVEERARRRYVATLAEDRFDDHRRRLPGCGDGLQQVVEPGQRACDLCFLVTGQRVRERSDVDPGRERVVPRAVHRLRCRHRHRKMGAPVEAAREHDDVRAPRRLLRQLDGGLRDLGAGVGSPDDEDRSLPQLRGSSVVARVELDDGGVELGRERRDPRRPEGAAGHDDLVGLDLTLDIQNVLIADLDNSTEPTQFLKDKVAAGKLGMRSGEGFRRWTKESADAVRERLRRYLAEQAKAGRKT